ncbi:hypothetical protein ACOJBM_00465 [Rhizobium beringeri]
MTDADGDGRTDTRRVETTSVSGNINIWERQYAADASTISTTITDVSGNGLTKSVSADLNHDGVGDRITSDQTVLNTDGSKTQTISLTSSDSTRLNKKTVVTSGNGMSITASSTSTATKWLMPRRPMSRRSIPTGCSSRPYPITGERRWQIRRR